MEQPDMIICLDEVITQSTCPMTTTGLSDRNQR